MRLDPVRGARAIALVTLAASPASACTAQTAEGKDPVDGASDSITDVNHTKVKRQSIGNCWTYATATWVESMALSATHEELDTSESYTTFWHWYNQIGSRTTEIQTGGSWSDATWRTRRCPPARAPRSRPSTSR
jgi:C1A family cysteine protease